MLDTRTCLLFCVAAALAACTESKQSGSPKAPAASPSPTVTPQPEPPDNGDGDGGDDLTPDCDPNKDFNQLDFSEDIKSCLRKEKVYNFDAETCTTMFKATFECTFAGVRAELKDLGLSTSNLDSVESRGLKLIGCGASNDGQTIITQAWQPTPDKKKDCAYAKQGKVVQSCYKKFVQNAPPEPVGDDAVKAYVTSCMTANSDD